MIREIASRKPTSGSYQPVEKTVHGFFNQRLAKTSFGQPLEMAAASTVAISAPRPCGAYQPV